MGKSCHDYRTLARRWRAVSQASGIRLRTIAKADGFPVFCMASPALESRGAVYLSAGIHGDEPGATEGLIAWAEARCKTLSTLPVLIFPCLNPWGLSQNRRSDLAGFDVNRMFHKTQHPTIKAVQTAARPYRFASGLMLHEDYDGEGIYLYEHHTTSPAGPCLLAAAEHEIPRDPRTRIEGHRVKNGLLCPRLSPGALRKLGHPEAIWLHLQKCGRSITFETPSEFALERRVAAHIAAIEAVVALCE